MRVKMEACYACSVRCKKVVHIEKKEEPAREAQEKVYGGKGKVGFDPLGPLLASIRATAAPSTSRSRRWA